MYIPLHLSNATSPEYGNSDIFSGSNANEFIVFFSGIGLLALLVLCRCCCVYYSSDKHSSLELIDQPPTYEESQREYLGQDADQ